MTENRCNYTKSYFLFQMGRLKTCTMFSVAFALLGFPLIILAYAFFENNFAGISDQMATPMFALGIACVLGTCAMSYITPVIALKHLFTKTNADNILSLPLTTTQRFIGDIGAVYTSFALPYLVSCGISAVIELTLSTTAEYLLVSEYVFKGFVLLMMFASLNMAVITCCGRLAEAILYPIALNIVMPLITVCSLCISYQSCVGSLNSQDAFRSPAVLIWPFGSLISLLFSQSAMLYLYGGVMTVIFTAASFLGYKTRRAENIGKTFVFKFSYAIVSTLVALSIIIATTYATSLETLGANTMLTIVLGVVILILMLIMEVINYKKVKNLIVFIVKFGATFGGGLLLCVLLTRTHGFGAESYIPLSSSVEWVEVYNNNDGVSQITAVNKDTINLIRDEHAHIIEKAKEFEGEKENLSMSYSSQYHQSISLTYTLKNGEYVYRHYYIDSPDVHTEGFWDKMYTSKDYRTQALHNLENNYLMGEVAIKTVRLINQHSNQVYVERDMPNIDTVLAALKQDLENDEQFGRHEELPVGIVQIGYKENQVEGVHAQTVYPNADGYFNPACNIVIYENYSATLSLLHQYGDVPTVEQAVEDSTKNSNKVFMLYRVNKSKSGYPNERGSSSYYTTDASAVFITADEFKELSAHQVSYHIPDDSEYVYYITRGVWRRIYDTNDITDILNAFDASEMEPEDRGFLSSDYIINNDNLIGNGINESMNDYCREIFADRPRLGYNQY